MHFLQNTCHFVVDFIFWREVSSQMVRQIFVGSFRYPLSSSSTLLLRCCLMLHRILRSPLFFLPVPFCARRPNPKLGDQQGCGSYNSAYFLSSFRFEFLPKSCVCVLSVVARPASGVGGSNPVSDTDFFFFKSTASTPSFAFEYRTYQRFFGLSSYSSSDVMCFLAWALLHRSSDSLAHSYHFDVQGDPVFVDIFFKIGQSVVNVAVALSNKMGGHLIISWTIFLIP